MNKTRRASSPAAEARPPGIAGAQPKTPLRGEKKTTAASSDPATPAAPAAPPSDPAETAATADPAPVLAASVNILSAEAGLYTLHIGATDRQLREISGMTVPATHVGAPASNGAGVEIVASYPQPGPWFGPAGGTAVINVPPGGGHIVVTSYGEPGQPAHAPAVDLRRLDGRDSVAAGPERPDSGEQAASIREIPTEIVLHIERAGDRVFPGRGWVGALGRKLRIESFSIRPLEGLLPGDVEFKGFEPNGQETPWVTAGTLCGTRGRGLPLTGFAVRLASHLRERFDAVYEGSFFNAGIVGPNRNGEPCRSAIGNDPLEAVNIRLIEKGKSRDRHNPAGR